jgi:FkbM family methyltransferase
MLNRLLCFILRIFVRLLTAMTKGKGGGNFATLLPKGQTFLVENYCGNFKFNVDTTYPIEGTIWLSGVYDIRTTRFLQKVIRPNDVFLDVGANCGALTFVAANAVETGKIYAFEPGAIVCQRLKANLQLNPQLKEVVEVFPLGLGKQRAQLFYSEDPNYRGNAALSSTEGIVVEVISLDEWVEMNHIPTINMIKIDVEGMEYEVLLGSKNVLKRDHPILYFETLPLFFENKSYSIETLYQFLRDLGYRIVYPESPQVEVPLAGPYPANSLAIHPKDFDRLHLATT